METGLIPSQWSDRITNKLLLGREVGAVDDQTNVYRKPERMKSVYTGNKKARLTVSQR